jgi:Acyl-CoA carboxylase epsilon subunit
VTERRAGAERPLLRVVAGDATPEEIAAVVAAVAATAAAVASEGHEQGGARATTSVWSAPGYAHRNIRSTFTPGADGWRTSFWPR